MIYPGVFDIRTYIWLKKLITKGFIGFNKINSCAIKDGVGIVINIAFIPRTKADTIISSLLIVKPIPVLFTPLLIDDLIDGMKTSMKLNWNSINRNGCCV